MKHDVSTVGKGGHVYLPHVDGLRALAVSAVVFFHAHSAGFGGGFVGVDIFFVISGFLITSILVRDMDAGKFSYAAFIERRIRRIFPALFLVLFVSSIAAYVLFLFPNDAQGFWRSLFSQSLFLSNFFFVRRAGYFAEPSETSPLLHTWTLSLEEQFYIVLPLVLFAAYVWLRKYLSLTMFAIGCVSFVYCVYLVSYASQEQFSLPFLPDVWGDTTNQTAGFFLLPARAWEFIAGACIVLCGVRIRSRWIAECVGIGGLLALITVVVWYDALTLFPGYAALVPVCGSVAFIVAGMHSTTTFAKCMSWRPLVWVGLISYPLYLWHWPLFVFAGVLVEEITRMQYLALTALAVSLAWLTYRIVETPIRTRVWFPTRTTVSMYALVLSVSFASLGFWLSVGDTADRIPHYARAFADETPEYPPKYEECTRDEADSVQRPCALGLSATGTPPSFLVWGDSHTAMMAALFDEWASSEGIGGTAFSYGSCLPVPTLHSLPHSASCDTMNSRAVEYIRTHDIRTIVFVARWNYYLGENEKHLVVDTSNTPATASTSRALFATHMRSLVEDLVQDGRRVVVVGQVPWFSAYSKRDAFYASLRATRAIDIPPVSLEQYRAQNEFSASVFRNLEDEGLVTFLDPSEFLCTAPEGVCPFYDDEGAIIYADDNHVNHRGARMLAPLITPHVVFGQ